MSRNIVNDYILYDKECIGKYLDIIATNIIDEKLVEIIIKTYIDVRYYDLYVHIDDSVMTTLDYYVKTETEKYLQSSEKKVSDAKLKRTINLSLWLIKYILYFEKATTDRKLGKLLEQLEFELKKKFEDVPENLKNDLFVLIRDNANNKKKCLRRTKCNDFHLDIKTTSNINVYDVDLVSDVKIPDLFSEVAIRRVYNSGIVKEDKLLVLFTLTSIEVLQNILNYDYDTNYLIEFDCNLFNKKNKINNLLKIIDLDLLKDKISLKINYEDFLLNKDTVYSYVKEGYKFAVILDETYDNSIEILDIFSYVVLDDKQGATSAILERENVIIRNK